MADIFTPNATLPGLTGVNVMNITVQTNANITGLNPPSTGQGNVSQVRPLHRLSRFFQKAMDGAWNINASITTGMSYAAALVTATGLTNASTFTVANNTFTGVIVSPPTSSQFLITSQTAGIASLVSQINAHPNVAPIVEAAAGGTTMRITSQTPGVIGNLIGLTQSLPAWGAIKTPTGVNTLTLDGGCQIYSNQGFISRGL